MASIVTKRIAGHDYLYLVESVRKGKQVIQKTIKYIGKKRPIPTEEFSCMVFSHEKKDWILSAFEDQLSYQDHHRMKQVSDAARSHLHSLDPVSQEQGMERFLTRFIWNSNAIEGSTLTYQDTYNYLFQDLAPKGKTKKELFMATNLLEAWRYVEIHHRSPPRQADVQQLHALVNHGIETDETLGKYKRVQNYVGDSLTTSHLFVEDRMKGLFSWLCKAEREINDFEVAFQSHAQFEIIHPFIDGNGRVGRLLLNWILLRKKLMPLAIPVDKRQEYLSALRNAQRGTLLPICCFLRDEYLDQHRFM